MVFKLRNSRVIIQSKPEQWGEWDEPYLVPYAPVSALHLRWPVGIDLAEAWSKVPADDIYRAPLAMVTLSRPWVAPGFDPGLRYDFKFADGTHVLIDAQEDFDVMAVDDNHC